MNTCKDLIKQFAFTHHTFGKQELWNWLKENGQTTPNTMSCMLTQLVDSGQLYRVSRGKYTLSSAEKSLYHATFDEKEKEVSLKLKDKFPFATFCIYNGRSLSSLQHHISENNITYIETERYVVESVFDYLRGEGYVVWQNPNADIIYMYVNLKDQSIIVKPLVTEAPTEIKDGIHVPTLEKVLVDIEKDPCFSYLRGTESSRMWENARQMYNINQTRLKRYAQRRGLKL